MRKHKRICLAMKGRKPKPIALREADGDTRRIGANKLREQIAAEPTATHGLPPCPEHIEGVAREAWEFWVAELRDMNLERRPDAQMLEGACVFYARARKADAAVDRDGITIEQSTIDEASGERILIGIKKNPAVDISKDAWTMVHRFCSEFGLSPVSRTRLAIEKKDDAAEDLANLLMRPRPARTSPVVQ